ncbi:hypothetical protein GM3708_2036 [Geminocystis sp. NIES-3708]|uniref:hypothetical protein n=1 Tax=Geminocystis sp. NIES-3708 TaxID=1615909 RepID=UPI0005FC4B93|nr:hypothetical protein [Geminocystis sp. NIES-3708]BAQ61630.1 hypothetical protein GM3708_2036 [Geminocystis sp. NIES-3708]
MSHILFNFSNIEKVTWIDRKDIKMIKVSSNEYCTVHLKSEEIIKVTAKEVKAVIGKERKTRSNNIEIVDNKDNTYTAKNLIKSTEYTLTPNDCFVDCTCPDYGNQWIVFEGEKALCKHGYALLNYLGFSSFEEYLEDIEEKQTQRQYQRYLEEQDYYQLINGEFDYIEHYERLDREIANYQANQGI